MDLCYAGQQKYKRYIVRRGPEGFRGQKVSGGMCAFTSAVGSVVDGGRAVAQAISRWLPTAAARVRFPAACGVCGGQSGTGAGFLRVLRFPLPIIPPIFPSF
jgi:hypothetical protein